jgi:hypothetical protein
MSFLSNVPEKVLGPVRTDERDLAVSMVEAMYGSIPPYVTRFLSLVTDPNAVMKEKYVNGERVAKVTHGDVASALRLYSVKYFVRSGQPESRLYPFLLAMEDVIAYNTKEYGPNFNATQILNDMASALTPGAKPPPDYKSIRRVNAAANTATISNRLTVRAELYRDSVMVIGAQCPPELLAFMGPIDGPDADAHVKIKGLTVSGEEHPMITFSGDPKAAVRHYAFKRFLLLGGSLDELAPFLANVQRVMDSSPRLEAAVVQISKMNIHHSG